MDSSNSDAIFAASKGANTSETFSSLLSVTSTIMLHIANRLQGTTPCHPNIPNGCSGHRLMLQPISHIRM